MIMKMYVYMSEDNLYAQLFSLCHEEERKEKVWFKAGITSNPKQRRYGLSSYGKKYGVQNLNQTIDKHTIEVPEHMAFIVEGYILYRIRLMPSVVEVRGELAYISIEDRQYCYDHMAQWVEEALCAHPC